MIKTPSSNNTNIKVTLIGDTNVGKTSIVKYYINKKKSNFEEPTIGGTFFTKKLSNNHKMEIWDTAGQERYNALIPMYYRIADIIIIVYDITNFISFKNLKFWLEEIKKNKRKDNINIFIVGNKYDLNKSIFNEEHFEKILNQVIDFQINIYHFKTSAKTGYNIDELFMKIIKSMPNKEANNTLLLKDINHVNDCCY